MSLCPRCEVWWSTHGPCWSCGLEGTREPRTHPARSWRNPATWVAEMETA